MVFAPKYGSHVGPVLFAPKYGATSTTFESEDGGGKVKCQTSFDMLSQNRWRRCITVTWVVICQGCSYFNATSIYNSRPPDTWLGFCLIHNSLIWFLKTIDYSWFSCLGLVGIYLDIDDISWWHKIQRLCIAKTNRPLLWSGSQFACNDTLLEAISWQRRCQLSWNSLALEDHSVCNATSALQYLLSWTCFNVIRRNISSTVYHRCTSAPRMQAMHCYLRCAGFVGMFIYFRAPHRSVVLCREVSIRRPMFKKLKYT